MPWYRIKYRDGTTETIEANTETDARAIARYARKHKRGEMPLVGPTANDAAANERSKISDIKKIST